MQETDRRALQAAARKAEENRDAAVERAGRLVQASPDKHLTAEDYSNFEGSLDAALQHEQRAQLATRLADVRVKSEPTVYGPKSGNSWFQDGYWIALNDDSPKWAEAKARRARYGQEVETWTGAEGARRDKFHAELTRSDVPERRSPMSTAAGFGGELVTPQYLLALVALYRPSLCSFAPLCTPMELPPSGVVVQVPNFTSTVTVNGQVENSGVSETDPGTGYLDGGSLPLFTANVSLQTGQVVASTQAFERSGPGYTLDQWVMRELTAILEDAVDLYTLQTVIAAITNSATSDTASWSTTAFWADVSKAKFSIATTNGTRYRPTHLFMNSNEVDKVEEQVDDDHRPIFTPDWATNTNADDGDTGYNIQSLRVMRDDNIPILSGNNQLIVSRPATVVLMRADPVPSVFVQTLANSLSVIMNLRQYVSVIPRYPNASQVITGSTYVTSVSP